MKNLFCIFLILPCYFSIAQSVDYNRVILPDNASDVTLEEHLVRLAWANYPLNDVYERNVKIADLDVKHSRWSFLDNINVVGNLNEFNIDQSRDIENRSQFYPRYNVSAGISLGMFVRIPLETKMSKERYHIEGSRLKARKLEFRAEVLQKYQAYKNAQEIFKVQSEIIEDAKTAFTYYEEQFKNGEIAFERYNEQKITYNKSRLTLLNSERELRATKIELERLIGIPLEDVL